MVVVTAGKLTAVFEIERVCNVVVAVVLTIDVVEVAGQRVAVDVGNVLDRVAVETGRRVQERVAFRQAERVIAVGIVLDCHGETAVARKQKRAHVHHHKHGDDCADAYGDYAAVSAITFDFARCAAQ